MTGAAASACSSGFPEVGYMPMPASFIYKSVFLHGRPQHRKYDDFWIRHPPMDTGHRAKIFAPFDALKWFDERIAAKEAIYIDRRILSEWEKEHLDTQIRLLQALARHSKTAENTRPAATVTYFEPCSDPENDAYMIRGTYRELTGIVQKIDPVVFRTITIAGKDIPLRDISEISCPLLPDPADEESCYALQR